MKRELVVATRNKKKLQEIKEILKGLRVRISSLEDHAPKLRIIENGRTFGSNAVKKACAVARVTGKLALGEDSGLCVAELGGRPGVYSSRFAGREKSDAKNNRKLLRLLEGVPASRRRACYRCAVALADKSGVISVTEGSCYGRIGFEERGSYGFGYDPLFVIPRYRRTFAQLGPAVKHRMSHRYRALKKMRTALVTYLRRNP